MKNKKNKDDNTKTIRGIIVEIDNDNAELTIQTKDKDYPEIIVYFEECTFDEYLFNQPVTCELSYTDDPDDYQTVVELYEEPSSQNKIQIKMILTVTLPVLLVVMLVLPPTRETMASGVAALFNKAGQSTIVYNLNKKTARPIKKYSSNPTILTDRKIQLPHANMTFNQYTVGLATIKNPFDDSPELENQRILKLNVTMQNKTNNPQLFLSVWLSYMELLNRNVTLRSAFLPEDATKLTSNYTNEPSGTLTKDLYFVLDDAKTVSLYNRINAQSDTVESDLMQTFDYNADNKEPEQLTDQTLFVIPTDRDEYERLEALFESIVDQEDDTDQVRQSENQESDQ